MGPKIMLDGAESLVQIRELLRATHGTTDLALSEAALAGYLQRFAAGELDAKDLGEICELLENEEAVAYPPGAESRIGTVLFNVTEPEINGQLTPARCRELLTLLGVG